MLTHDSSNGLLARRVALAGALALLLGIAPARGASALTFALPPLGGVSEFEAFIRTDNLAVLANPVGTSPPVAASESQPVGGFGGSIQGTATADRGWLSGSYSVQAWGSVAFLDVESGFDLVDIVISGPGSSVNGSVNLVREGVSTRPIGDDLTIYGTFFGIGDTSCGTLGGCFTASIGLTATPWSDTYVSPLFSLPVGTPFTFGLAVGTSLGGGANQSHGASWAVHFPVGSAVFNLPAGYTIDSSDGAITANLFQVPEPTILLLLSVGLGGFGLLGRRRLD